VDTGAFLARVDEDDQFHALACKGWDALAKTPWQLITSEHVVDETITLLARRLGAKLATKWASLHLNSAELKILPCTPPDWKLALKFMDKFSDQRLSFTDCLSFALMKRTATSRVFGFDSGFHLLRFQMWKPI
jgi:uncharacterized protein